MNLSREGVRLQRKRRVRKKVSGTTERPRMTVFRSLKHLYVQLVDDGQHKTLLSASTQAKDGRSAFEGMSKTDQAKKLGEQVADLCKQKGVTSVVFDRNGYRYHGRVQALASAAREGGLVF